MKKNIAVLSALIIFILPKVHSQTIVNGSLKKVKDTVNWVFAYYAADGKRVTDSAEVKNNKYSFNLNVTEPTQVTLRARKYEMKNGVSVLNNKTTKKDIAFLFLEKGKASVESVDSFSNVKVKGSKANDEFVKLTALAKPYNDKMQALSMQYGALLKEQKKDEAKKIEEQLDELDAKLNDEVYGNYAKNNPQSPLALYALQRYAGYENPEKAEPIFNTLPASVQESTAGAALKNKMEVSKKTGIGKYAMNFTQNDTLGNPVSLSSFKGKYVLVDFWASWCGPCRRENPNVVKAYNKYKDKGFHILSVSLDQPNAKDKWIKAIHDDHLTWTHVSDLKFWDNEVAKMYGIQAIPANLLLDPEGKIIAKNLRGEDLDAKLAAVLK
ncbi:MAG: AhpC/TSA family protein [Bacteroidetes bacterium]|nr:AhpC/TSA family protein [Bacteroidota bacterium]MBS1648452.1 AhpC/TSA family protein [Bacteroidota bacterium]